MSVLMLVANGSTTKDVAHLLAISQDTVDNDISWMQGRLHAVTRAQVVALAVGFGLLHRGDLEFDGTAAWVEAFLQRHTSEEGDRLTSFASGIRMRF